MIKVSGLTCRYGNLQVFHDLNFEIKNGDYLVIVGENGSGKSTLLKTILGLKKPDSGHIMMEDFKDIGYVPQENNAAKNFPALVKEVIMSGIISKNKFFYNKKDYQKLQEVSTLLELDKILNNSISELSGGQKKRVMLARALVRGADILFLDEPTSSLDPLRTSDFYSTLDRLNADGRTIVTVSHDLRSIINCAKTVLHLGANDQGVLFFGAKEDYIKSELFKVLSGVHIHE